MPAGDWRSGSALPSHGRGHWFEPSIAHMSAKQPKAIYLSRIDRNIGDRESAVALRRSELNALCSDSQMTAAGGPFFEGVHLDLTQPELWPEFSEIAYVGGGGLVGPRPFEAGWAALKERGIPVVVWAIGHNFSRHQAKESVYYELTRQSNVFVRERCHCSGKPPIPCPSMFSPQFAHTRARSQLIGIYEHANRKLPLSNSRRLNNKTTELSLVLDAIARNWLTITNSYHGALWARRLGRRAISVDRFTDKFSCIPRIRGEEFMSTTMNASTSEAVDSLAKFVEMHFPTTKL